MTPWARCVWLAKRIWAAPYSALGATIGGLGVIGGGHAQYVDGVWEFSGPFVAWVLDRLPLQHVLALTLGHTVLGRHLNGLEVTRAHERVHVRQFERWGPLMGPAYVGCSLWLRLRGQDWYRENPFEREAYDEVP